MGRLGTVVVELAAPVDKLLISPTSRLRQHLHRPPTPPSSTLHPLTKQYRSCLDEAAEAAADRLLHQLPNDQPWRPSGNRSLLNLRTDRPLLQPIPRPRCRQARRSKALVFSGRWLRRLRMFPPLHCALLRTDDIPSGVAVGSSIGHAIGGFFGGGSGSAPAEAEQATNAVAQPSDANYNSNQYGPRSCENDAKMFTQCLDQNQGNMQICGWYLEQLVRRCTR